MSFSSWVGGDNNNGNSNQGNTSSDDAEVNSNAHYVNPMASQNVTYGLSFNVQDNFQSGRSSFHFGHQSHENSDMFCGPKNLEPGRSSFHFGEQHLHYRTPFVSQFQSSLPYGATYEGQVGTSVHVGERNEAYKLAPYCVDSDVGCTSSNPPPESQYIEQELTDAFNYPGNLNHVLGSVQEERDGMEVEEEEEEEEEEKEEEEEVIVEKKRYKNIMGVLAAKVANQFNLQKKVRIPYHTDGLSGKEWVDNVVNSNHPDRCQDVFGMQPDLFRQLEVELVLRHGFQPPKKSTGVGVRECLGYFIAMLRGFTSQALDDRFQRSGGTISKQIKKITPALEDFAAKWVAPFQDHDYWRPYLERSKKYCHFQDCIGAVDGTHIPCNPPRAKAANFWSRKGMYTFNVLAVADFNLCFTFAVTGYEGAMHDYQIFKEETLKPNNRYPHPPPGKYYLVDAGYPNAKGYLAPYKGYMYHQDEFRRRSVPVTDSNELFNKAHSSLRSCVERSFGVLKKRYPFLKTPSEYKFQEVKKFILIAMGLHNYIRWHNPADEYFRDAEMSNENYVSEDSTNGELRRHEFGDGPHFAQIDWEMDRFRDGLRDRIALDHRRRNQRHRAR